jgi:hypothetical protein
MTEEALEGASTALGLGSSMRDWISESDIFAIDMRSIGSEKKFEDESSAGSFDN